VAVVSSIAPQVAKLFFYSVWQLAMMQGGPTLCGFIFYDNIICRPFLWLFFMTFLRLSVRGLSLILIARLSFWQPAQVFIWLMSSGQNGRVWRSG